MTKKAARICAPFSLLAAVLATMLVLATGGALAQDKLRVAAVFETPIEEPWVNQIHVALQQAAEELGIEYTWSESVKSADFARVMRTGRAVLKGYGRTLCSVPVYNFKNNFTFAFHKSPLPA